MVVSLLVIFPSSILSILTFTCLPECRHRTTALLEQTTATKGLSPSGADFCGLTMWSGGWEMPNKP